MHERATDLAMGCDFGGDIGGRMLESVRDDLADVDLR